ncbi:branched-chain amino acid ABC transporter permease [Pigmentiphaga litoralis]|uniref:Branched-chain amino acid transport system permease protein n=1 Tax=Pigmentiphaga litoralis TaxID=516702 RepID=A0A7Y9ISU1_9BURK|nr:branched-chain amino acid ABC transporter permease [Pigmentiphaga litoralis]NYE23980.1 branched-chain amino acid transport system permease protein [Pigmentiphaga litoralis]NYE82406.1 branched-chain amino acid transport system permease protein [Pigmentiphaga litoralis]
MSESLTPLIPAAPARPVPATGWLDWVARHRVLVTLAFFAVFPWLMPYQSVAINILIFGLYAVGFNLLFGYTGLLSFGHAAFLGVGGYTAGILIAQHGAAWWWAIPAAVVMAAVVALVMGLLAIRTRGIYFAMVTLALSQCVYFLVYQLPASGGENGLRGANVSDVSVFGLHLNLLDPMQKYYFMLAFVAVALLALSRILASPFGGVIEAIRENESRARACGFNVERSKLLAFVLSAAFCGLAGALYAIHLSSVAIETLAYTTSGMVVMLCLLGGMGTYFGPFVGAALFLVIQDVISEYTENWQLYVGAVFVFFVLFFPKGVWGTLLEKLRHDR